MRRFSLLLLLLLACTKTALDRPVAPADGAPPSHADELPSDASPSDATSGNTLGPETGGDAKLADEWGEDSAPDPEATDGPWSSTGGDAASDALPADTRALRVQSDAFNGWLGGSCNVNADCSGSPAATAVVGLHCPSETFCLDHLCHSECIVACAMGSGPPTPCLAPRFCVAFPSSGGISFCRIAPLLCTTDHDCPLPAAVDGGASWTCTNGTCQLPGFQYPTQ